MSTGDAHPLAHGEVVPEFGHSVILDLCGDYLLESLLTPGLALVSLVRNWKTGTVESKQQNGYYQGAEAQDDMMSRHVWFLDDEHIIIEARSAHKRRSDTKCLLVVPFRRRSKSDAPVYVFSLPGFLSGPESWWDCVIPGRASGHLHPGHFHADPDNRLISMYTAVRHRDGLQRLFVVDIPVQTFLSYVRAHPAAASQQVVVPWDAWGTRGARVTLVPASPRQPGMPVSGMRRIDVPVRPPYAVTVVDYHPRRVARAIARGDPAVVHGAFVDTEVAGLGEGRLHTLLPCLVTEVPLPEGLAQRVEEGRPVSVWFDENGVLFVETRGADGTVKSVWAYTI
ncbi:hypothetical protein BV25DRAFT_1722914 [Artomyces pyxidatus]|uniref:Uncharacterized protein n=1 Tax=Artomyces pyxidatus TaxID=48021 RepID=A0ACB8SH62_9AGAM|nr:hypothetical protein BV25DRAFT_1722914 [Artomyces pyxidatus]